jgi:hypothetical protein
LLALLCGGVFAGRVYSTFEPIRVKVATSSLPSEEGRVSVAVPPARSADRLGSPAVLIAQLQNPSSSAIGVAAAIEGRRIATVTVDARDTRRVDLATRSDVPVRPGDVITFSSARSGWTLEYLEVANIFGSSRNLLPLLIVPASLREYARPPLVLAVLLTIAIWGIALVDFSTPVQSRRRAVLRRLLQAVAVLFLTLVLASALISPFKLIVPVRTFCLTVALLFSVGLWRAILEARAQVIHRMRAPAHVVDAMLVGSVAAAFYVIAMFVALPLHGGNYSGFLHLSKQRIEQVEFLQQRHDLLDSLVLLEKGAYDGQFAYLITFDPWLRLYKEDPTRYGTMVDAAPYRFGRIGYSVLTKIVSGDNPPRYPATMIWLLIAGNLVAATFLALIVAHHGRHPAWGLLYLVVPGLHQSLQVGLPESLAAAGLLAGYWAWLTSRPWAAACAFGLSLLFRETGAVFLLALVAVDWVQKRDLKAVAILSSGFLPLMAWRSYLCWRLFPAWGWQGLFFNPENTGFPLAGIWDLWTRLANGTYYPDDRTMQLAGTFYPVLLVGALVLAVAYCWRHPSGLGAALIAFGAIALSLNYPSIWANTGNGERGTYELLLLSIVAWASLTRSWWLHVSYLGYFGALAAYLLLASINRNIIRQVLGI